MHLNILQASVATHLSMDQMYSPAPKQSIALIDMHCLEPYETFAEMRWLSNKSLIDVRDMGQILSRFLCRYINQIILLIVVIYCAFTFRDKIASPVRSLTPQSDSENRDLVNPAATPD